MLVFFLGLVQEAFFVHSAMVRGQKEMMWRVKVVGHGSFGDVCPGSYHDGDGGRH